MLTFGAGIAIIAGQVNWRRYRVLRQGPQILAVIGWALDVGVPLVQGFSPHSKHAKQLSQNSKNVH